MAKETITRQHVLELIFQHFDMGKHCSLHNGLVVSVLHDMSYIMQNIGDDDCLLSILIINLDPKNVVHQPQMQNDKFEIVVILARYSRPKAMVSKIGEINDLSRNLRKSI